MTSEHISEEAVRACRCWFTRPRCQHKALWTGVRCTRPARWVVRAPYGELLLCGNHRRGWTWPACYPLGAAAVAVSA